MNGKPEENKIREAFEEVRLPEGAKERMYANILQKAKLAKANASSQTEEASQQAEMQEAPQGAKTAQPKKFKRISWRKYASLAACLIIFIAAGTFLPGIFGEDSVIGSDTTITPPASEAPLMSEAPDIDEAPSASEPPDTATTPEDSDSVQKNQPPAASQQPNTKEDATVNDDITLSPSPFEDVTSAEDFSKKLGFSIDAPEGSTNIFYSVAFGETAIVDFSFANHAYTYYASKKVDDISSGDGSTDTLSQTWEDGGINYLLLNTDGASKEELEEVVAALQNS